VRLMRRPLLTAALAFSTGITLAYYHLPLLYLLVLPLIYLFFHREKGILIILLFFLIGFAWLSWQEAKYWSDFSLACWNDQEQLQITGEVVEDLSSLRGYKVFLKPLLINQQPVKYGLIQLDQRYLSSELNNGEIITTVMSLKTPSRQLNPGGFSNYKYLKKKGVYSQGYVKGKIVKISRINHLFKDFIINLKARFIYLLDTTLPDPYNHILQALILGERDNLPEEWNQQFTEAGANHLLAISGLHVGFVLLIFLGFFSLSGLSTGLRSILITCLLIIYIILTGLRPAILRAGILALSFLWASYLKREGDIFNLLGLTAIINLLINPYELFMVGFQLTYLVLIMIILWGRVLSNYLNPVLSISIAAQIGSIPLTAYYFNLLTPVGILTNIWAIPLVGLIVSAAIAGLMLGLIHPVFCWLVNRVLYYFLIFLKQGMALMTAIPLGQLEIYSPSVFSVVLAYGFLIFFPFVLNKRVVPVNIIKQKKRIRLTLLVFLLVIIIHLIIPLFQHNLEVIFLAVGQGDGIFLRLPSGRSLLVDGGGMAGPETSKGQTVILPFLKNRGTKKLDLAFITHFDTDHALGIASLLKEKRIKLLVIPVNYKNNELAEGILAIARKNKIPVKQAADGDSFQIGEVFLRVLNPPVDPTERLSSNDNSLVLQVIYRNFSLLLTGDIEKTSEDRLVREGYNLDCDVLKLGHHGSRSSSSYSLLQRVSPIEGIISVGPNNFGHPSPTVIERATDLGIRLWRTDQQGAIILKTDGYSYSIEGYKK
jgi:competence protein ComEC